MVRRTEGTIATRPRGPRVERHFGLTVPGFAYLLTDAEPAFGGRASTSPPCRPRAGRVPSVERWGESRAPMAVAQHQKLSALAVSRVRQAPLVPADKNRSVGGLPSDPARRTGSASRARALGIVRYCGRGRRVRPLALPARAGPA